MIALICLKFLKFNLILLIASLDISGHDTLINSYQRFALRDSHNVKKYKLIMFLEVYINFHIQVCNIMGLLLNGSICFFV